MSGKTNAHSLQCPMVDTDCPTCGEFRSMQELVRKIQLEYQQEITRLKDRVKINSKSILDKTFYLFKQFAIYSHYNFSGFILIF